MLAGVGSRANPGMNQAYLNRATLLPLAMAGRIQ
jgi:hypothetical protein